MTFLTGAGIIDGALSIIRNNSTPIRTKMLVWLNILSKKLIVARPNGWTFFENGSAIITPSGSTLTMPADFGELKSIRGGTTFFLDNRHRLTESEAFSYDNNATGLLKPVGFTEAIADVTVGESTVKRTAITLHGAGYSDDCVVTYRIHPATFADSTTETAWPSVCEPLLQRGLLDAFYEYDMDERAATSYQLNEILLSELKAYDNMRKPRTQNDPRGLRRTR